VLEQVAVRWRIGEEASIPLAAAQNDSALRRAIAIEDDGEGLELAPHRILLRQSAFMP
jgi:hypothetical protein